MQTGFDLLEAGAVSAKNEVNIMVKNVVDCITGGLLYWAVGYGLSYGGGQYANAFVGYGDFFVGNEKLATTNEGNQMVSYTFQLSFATTATTIVSGAIAERTKLSAYIAFSLLNTLVYALPCHWVWDHRGFLYKLGALDFAGSGLVHLMGGISGLCGAFLLGPRLGRYKNLLDQLEEGDIEDDEGTTCLNLRNVVTRPDHLGDSVNSILGCFILWWGWIGFNCGSAFGISGSKWQIACKVAVTTLTSSLSAGCCGFLISFFRHKQSKFDVEDIVNSILGGLVSVTGSCAMVEPWEAIVTGAVASFLTIGSTVLLDRVEIDDPIGAVPIHGVCGFWGVLAVGIFAQNPPLADTTWVTRQQNGLIHGGGVSLLLVQLLFAVIVIMWSFTATWLIMWPLHKTVGLRLSARSEILGADYAEHEISHIKPDIALMHALVNHKTMPAQLRWKVRRLALQLHRQRSYSKTLSLP